MQNKNSVLSFFDASKSSYQPLTEVFAIVLAHYEPANQKNIFLAILEERSSPTFKVGIGPSPF